jgi:hypothetical protein
MIRHGETASGREYACTLRPTDTPALRSPDLIEELCQRIASRVSHSSPKDARDAAAQSSHAIHRGLSMDLSKSDHDAALGYQWPASRLTDTDMRRLRLLSNLTRLPCNELLHVAVELLHQQTRGRALQLLGSQQQVAPLQPGPHVQQHVGTQHPGDKPDVAISAGPATPQPSAAEIPWTPPRPNAVHNLPHEQREQSLLAAEPSAVSSSPTGSSTARPTKRRTKSVEPDPVANDAHDTLADEVRQLREEVRVVWEAVDELRESMEHALRNPPEPPPPPFRLTSMAADPTAEDFAERLNAIPLEQIEALRREVTATPRKENGSNAAAKQGRLFS